MILAAKFVLAAFAAVTMIALLSWRRREALTRRTHDLVLITVLALSRISLFMLIFFVQALSRTLTLPYIIARPRRRCMTPYRSSAFIPPTGRFSTKLRRLPLLAGTAPQHLFSSRSWLSFAPSRYRSKRSRRSRASNPPSSGFVYS